MHTDIQNSQATHARDHFPLGIAAGNAFCNRTEETHLLAENLLHGKHTLIMATRRYGKSSLALRALKHSKLPYVEADFYMASNEKAVEAYILTAVVTLIGSALGSIDRLLTSIKKYVRDLRPRLDIGAPSLHLTLTPEPHTDPASSVQEALNLLEKLLAEKNKRAVLLMDEFQNVGLVSAGSGIEAAIRNVAQKTKYLTFIFSGSNRNMLKTMFEDKSRPLYKLCWKITLTRISDAHYRRHIQHAAQLTWKQALNEKVLYMILLVTERHPYYVNKLCDRIWAYAGKKLPTLAIAEKAWNDTLDEDRSDTIQEITRLSPSQKKVLQKIAHAPEVALTGQATLLDLKMTSSSVIAALAGLQEKDAIEKEAGSWQIINPIMKHYALLAPAVW